MAVDPATIATKVAVPIVKASANPVIRAFKAKKRRNALLVLLTRSVYEVERQRPSPGAAPTTNSLSPEPHTHLAERMLEIATTQLVKDRWLRKVGHLFGYSNPPDELANIPGDEATTAVYGWATVALSEAWTEAGETKPESVIQSDAKLIALQFWAEVQQSFSYGSETKNEAVLIAHGVTHATEVRDKAANLHTFATTITTAGALTAANAIAFADDHWVNSGGRPAVIAGSVAITAGAALLSRSRQRWQEQADEERVGEKRPLVAAAIRVTLAWLTDLATYLVRSNQRRTPTLVQLSALVEKLSDPDTLSRPPGDWIDGVQDRLHTNVFDAVRRSGDETLEAILTLMDDHLYRLKREAPSYDVDEFAYDIGVTLVRLRGFIAQPAPEGAQRTIEAPPARSAPSPVHRSNAQL